MEIEKLKHPIWFINPNITKTEKIYHIQNLQVVTKLTLEKTGFVNWYLYDGTNSLFKISKVSDLGNYNKSWVFEFFNPMRKIELVLEEVNDDSKKSKIKLLINEPDENDH